MTLGIYRPSTDDLESISSDEFDRREAKRAESEAAGAEVSSSSGSWQRGTASRFCCEVLLAEEVFIDVCQSFSFSLLAGTKSTSIVMFQGGLSST